MNLGLGGKLLLYASSFTLKLIMEHLVDILVLRGANDQVELVQI